MAIKTFSAGEQLTASDTNTYLANAGLVYVTSGSATSGTAVNVNNCFTSTYDNYRIMIDYFQPASTSQALYLRMRVGGVDATTTDYYYGHVGIYADGTSSNSNGSAQNALSTGMYNSASTIAVGSAVLDVFAPAKAERTFFVTNAILYNTQFGGRSGMGEHNLTTAYDGFTLTMLGATFTNIRYAVYGYRKA